VQTDILKKKLEGCYVTVPTPFRDSDGLPVDEEALRAYVRFLIGGGLTADNAVFLAGGAAGDFSTMTFDERLRVAEVVIAEVGGRVPVAMGAQTTSTLELVRLALRVAVGGLRAHVTSVSKFVDAVHYIAVVDAVH